MITCKECNHECSGANTLSYHLRHHGMKYVDYVVKHNHGGIWPTCRNCGIELELKLGGFRKFCSKSCGSSGTFNGMHGMKGVDSPNFGKVRTPEHRRKYKKASKQRWIDHGDRIRAKFKTEEYRRMQSNAQKASYATKPEQRQKRIDAVHAFWSSDRSTQARQDATDRAIKLIDEGIIGPQAPYQCEWKFNPFTNRNEYMHCSWETRFLDKCIKENVRVIKKHELRIPYVNSEGLAKTYYPDFVSLDERIVFEIKGLADENDAIKIDTLKEWAKTNDYDVVVITKKDVKRWK